jgi:putative membrane protein
MNKDLILREKLALQRTVMANQSTFLAFLRTSMYFFVAGVSIRTLLHLDGYWVDGLLYAVSALLLVTGIYNYFHHRRLIRESERHVGDFKLEYLREDKKPAA